MCHLPFFILFVEGSVGGVIPFLSCVVLHKIVMKSRHHLPFFFLLFIIFVLKNCTQLSYSVKLCSKNSKKNPLIAVSKLFPLWLCMAFTKFLSFPSLFSYMVQNLASGQLYVYSVVSILSLVSIERENWNDGRLNFRSKAWVGAIIWFPFLHFAFPFSFG